MFLIIISIFIPLILSIILAFYISKSEKKNFLITIGLFLSYVIAHLSIYKNIPLSPVQSTDYIPIALFISLLFSFIFEYKKLDNFPKLIIKVLNYCITIGIVSVPFIKFTWQDNQKILFPTIFIFLTLLFDYLTNKKQENSKNFDNFLFIFLSSLLGSIVAVFASIATFSQILGAISSYIFPLLLLFLLKEKDINIDSINLIFNSFYSIILINLYLLSPNEPPFYTMIIITLSPLTFILVNKLFSNSKNLTKIFIKSLLTVILFLTSAILIDNPFSSVQNEETYNYDY
ncbi:MAG: hypothetical protein KatS3mg068_1694 [Candidatus Sericytochromatia bacterium]|nr:MAG: hypothetical protein KatS3mg068_1694 [Candidatus Sericytochromatia bacterium]